jgi:hypothetical protein
LGEGWWEVVIGSAGVDMHLSADRLAAVSLMTVLLALPFGALALAVSCAVGRRGVTIGVAAAAAGAAYLLNARRDRRV